MTELVFKSFGDDFGIGALTNDDLKKEQEDETSIELDEVYLKQKAFDVISGVYGQEREEQESRLLEIMSVEEVLRVFEIRMDILTGRI